MQQTAVHTDHSTAWHGAAERSTALALQCSCNVTVVSLERCGPVRHNRLELWSNAWPAGLSHTVNLGGGELQLQDKGSAQGPSTGVGGAGQVLSKGAAGREFSTARCACRPWPRPGSRGKGEGDSSDLVLWERQLCLLQSRGCRKTDCLVFPWCWYWC